ncbi:MAG: hypothetical protein HY006_02235 [Candidatus Sungbacteria bacterium]|nr:hypothetical protein [Candidatus Sungbacteria bacterium]
MSEETTEIRHRFMVGGEQGILYVEIKAGRPREIDLEFGKENTAVWGFAKAFAVAISLMLAAGIPLSELIKKFVGMRFIPYGRTGHPSIHSATSVVDYVFRWLEFRFLRNQGGKTPVPSIPAGVSA